MKGFAVSAWARSNMLLKKHTKNLHKLTLGGGFNSFEKYASQIGSFPQVGMKIPKAWNHHPERFLRIPLNL